MILLVAFLISEHVLKCANLRMIWYIYIYKNHLIFCYQYNYIYIIFSNYCNISQNFVLFSIIFLHFKIYKYPI